MFAVRNHRSGIQHLVAACDEELLGTTHSEGQLRLAVEPGFYDGMRVERKELETFLLQCTMANLVGKACIDVAIELGLVDPKNVATVEDVPHAQFMALLP